MNLSVVSYSDGVGKRTRRANELVSSLLFKSVGWFPISSYRNSSLSKKDLVFDLCLPKKDLGSYCSHSRLLFAVLTWLLRNAQRKSPWQPCLSKAFCSFVCLFSMESHSIGWKLPTKRLLNCRFPRNMRTHIHGTSSQRSFPTNRSDPFSAMMNLSNKKASRIVWKTSGSNNKIPIKWALAENSWMNEKPLVLTIENYRINLNTSTLPALSFHNTFF